MGTSKPGPGGKRRNREASRNLWTDSPQKWIIVGVRGQVGSLNPPTLSVLGPLKEASLPHVPNGAPPVHHRRPALANDKDSISNLRSESSKTDKRKQSLYFPESMLQEIKEEAARLDRSLSWVVQRAWKISRLEIKKLPSVNEVDGGEDDDEG
jgi:uncharacterized small protein (TIGR04563 family)